MMVSELTSLSLLLIVTSLSAAAADDDDAATAAVEGVAMGGDDGTATVMDIADSNAGSTDDSIGADAATSTGSTTGRGVGNVMIGVTDDVSSVIADGVDASDCTFDDDDSVDAAASPVGAASSVVTYIHDRTTIERYHHSIPVMIASILTS